MTTPARPPRTAAHVERDRLIQQFHDAGLQAVVSTNGSIPDADIQVAFVTAPEGGQALSAWLTAKGQARLDEGM